MSTRPKVIVLDDDPTGSQTVHSCLLLTRWDQATLKLGLLDESPIVFILTNTRAMTATAAAETTRTVCQHLKQALTDTGIQDVVLVSRSDSTLRGHYPVETDVIAEELGPFDGHFLVPAFFEGGRITRDSTHYLQVGDHLTPVHETEFARDSVFGYHHSYLPDYVAEKTQHRISADQVLRLQLADLRSGCQEQLRQMSDNRCGVVDGEVQADLDQFAADLLAVTATGKRFLLRSAASILTSLAALPPQPIAPEDMAAYSRSDAAGAVIVGSHVRKTTQQLHQLLQEPDVTGVEVEIAQLLQDTPAHMQTGEHHDALLATVLDQVHKIHASGHTPVIYTSREELTFADATTRLAFGTAVSTLLMDILRGLPPQISFLISKGGITSNDTLSQGLALASIRLLGQIAPGCSVVMAPADHPQFPRLPVVLFPGNVGDEHTLALVYRRLHR
jgi:uncharacterized protein YgbK (DUF1537 family)